MATKRRHNKWTSYSFDIYAETVRMQANINECFWYMNWCGWVDWMLFSSSENHKLRRIMCGKNSTWSHSFWNQRTACELSRNIAPIQTVKFDAEFQGFESATLPISCANCLQFLLQHSRKHMACTIVPFALACANTNNRICLHFGVISNGIKRRCHRKHTHTQTHTRCELCYNATKSWLSTV